MVNKVDPRVTRMLHARTGSPQDPSNIKAAAPMFSKGGKATVRGHGIEQRGKTKGKFV